MKRVALIIGLVVCMIVGAWLRVRDLGNPKGYMYDEIYHVPTFILMARGDVRAYEWWHGELKDEFGAGTYIDWLHPPLAKLVQALFFKIGGNHYFLWRLPAAIMGTLLIGVVFLLARATFPESSVASLVAALLVTVDGLAIAMSRIAMNDMFVTTFVGLALWCYWQHCREPQKGKWLWGTLAMTGLACASKWSGFWLFPFFVVWEFVRKLVFPTIQNKQIWAKIVFFVAGAFLIYVLSYGQMFWLGHGVTHLAKLHQEILNYQLNLDATHPYSSKAYQWPLGLKPVYLYHDETTGKDYWNSPFYPTWYLALGCLVVEIMTFSIDFYDEILRPKLTGKKGNYREKLQKFFGAHESQLFLILGYFALWTPWLLSPRIMYFHHYLPALPCLWALAGGTMGKLLDKPIKKCTASSRALTT